MNSAEPILSLTGPDHQEVVRRFMVDLRSGVDWFEALTQAIALWRVPDEVVDGCHYRYLVADEAFDWLFLAERLLATAEGLVPRGEKEDLLFHGLLPRGVSEERFKKQIGPAKYGAVINHWYGIRVEEALILAVEHEVRKQRHGLRPEELRLDEAVYEHIYGLPRHKLLHLFSEERAAPYRNGLSLRQNEEFTYWLFRYRLKRSDKARLASDTKKGITFLKQLGRLPGPGLLGPVGYNVPAARGPAGWPTDDAEGPMS